MAEDISLEECPYHCIKPWQLDFLDCKIIDSNGDIVQRRPNVFDVFKDAMLFCHGCTVFCPKCAKKSPTPGKHNKFGYGYCSQWSLQEAKKNWNKAVRRFAKSQIKKVLAGKA